MSKADQISKFSLSTVVTVLVVLLIFSGLVWFLASDRSSIASGSERRELRLKNLSDLNTENRKTLTSYRWVDKAKGIVGIPIDRAMELEVADLASLRPRPAGPVTQPAPSPPATGSSAQKPSSAPSPAGNQVSPNPSSATTPGTPVKP
jgi:hypothetical protein